MSDDMRPLADALEALGPEDLLLLAASMVGTPELEEIAWKLARMAVAKHHTYAKSSVAATEPEAELVDAIVRELGQHFRCFGGGRDSMNPMAHALKDQPLQFAAGVDVREVISAVLIAVAKHDQGAR
jgi:hypothetical protein